MIQLFAELKQTQGCFTSCRSHLCWRDPGCRELREALSGGRKNTASFQGLDHRQSVREAIIEFVAVYALKSCILVPAEPDKVDDMPSSRQAAQAFAASSL